MSTQISAATNCWRKWTNTRYGELCTNGMANGRTCEYCVFVPAPRWTLDKLLSVFYFLFLFSRFFFVFWFFVSPFSAIRHSINVTTTDMQKKKKIRLHSFVNYFFSSRCFVWNSNGRIMFTFFFVSMEKWGDGDGVLEWHRRTREQYSLFSVFANNLENKFRALNNFRNFPGKRRNVFFRLLSFWNRNVLIWRKK